MLTTLMRDAIQNVWCAPEQDYRSILVPKRLSPAHGSRGFQRVMWEDIALPTAHDDYHVFQIGGIKPRLLGLLTLPKNEWTSLQHLINTSDLFGQAYLNDGRIIPRFNVRFRFDRHQNLLMAVRDYEPMADVRTEKVSLHLTTNAYFHSPRFEKAYTTYCNGRVVSGDSDVVAIQNDYHTYRNLAYGLATAYHNGQAVDDITPMIVSTGDLIEFVFDASVERVHSFTVGDLYTFDSTKDTVTKYLLHPGTYDNDEIEFEDDIDVYVFQDLGNGRERGVYLRRNESMNFRNVTHRDHSIPTTLLDEIQVLNESFMGTVPQLEIRLHVRKPGIDRSLIYDDRRIFELYKLDSDVIQKTLAGIHANVSFWQAASLEESPYIELLRNKGRDLDPVQVQQAYGYNSISRLIGDTPMQVTSEDDSFVLPPAYRYQATIYEFDSDGYLLGFYSIQNQLEYTIRNATTVYCELVTGLADEKLDVGYGVLEKPRSPLYHYRAYRCELIGDEPTWEWEDITDDPTLTTFETDRVVLTVDTSLYYTAIVSDRRFISYNSYIEPTNGQYYFPIRAMEDHGEGEVLHELSIPPRRIDLWMDGEYLIEGVDYEVNWPYIGVNRYTNIAQQEKYFTVRCYGLIDSTMVRSTGKETGFVQHGYLSNDRQYDLRDDRVLSYYVGGKLIPRDQLHFAEENSGVSVDGFANGTPYAVVEHLVSLRDAFMTDTYTMREDSRAKGETVRDFMQQYYEEPVIDELLSVPSLYTIYSPFMGRVVQMLANEVFSESQLIQGYSEMDIQNWLSDVTYLLDVDLVYQGYDERFLIPYPHPFENAITLTPAQYEFVRRVNRLYFNDAIVLSGFFEIVTPGTT